MDIEKLRDRMKRTGLTHPELAAGSGCSLSWVSKIMSGHITNPQLKSLNAMEAFLKSTRPKK